MVTSSDCPVVRYCSTMGISLRAFARMINRSPQLLSDYVHGTCGLGEDAYLAAVAVTGGALSLEELVAWGARARQWRRENRKKREAEGDIKDGEEGYDSGVAEHHGGGR